MTVTLDRATTPRAPESAVRLSLAPGGIRAGRLDGAWWPRSRDLLLELPSLVAELDKRWGRVTRITVNPAQWPAIPRRVPVAGHTVHVGWFTTEQDQHVIMVFSYAPLQLELLVVPPSTDAVDGARLMSEAADPASTGTASALLAAGGDGNVVAGEFRSDFLPSAATPTSGPGEADRRANVARMRAAAWPEP
ncbi:DUF5994 family protein [Saccharothrix sp. ST-888]|uniref:DUF5994 family protein n=1 Tax=Saccharothrix sp. ST-888 TaxID=1427391 RepID=UPI000AF0D802|nr:DUF5994 family protein [Saccharothrix sp. ST-888]